MSETDKTAQSSELADDSLAYAQAQAGGAAEDPLATVKQMRLEQLAVCRLKSKEEMQAMRDALQTKETPRAED